MKYCVLIMDGAAGWPLKECGSKTSLELARTPNLNYLASTGSVGLTNTIPSGMEPSSAVACMSLLGYNPETYYRGRAAIEAVSMGIPIAQNEVVFRCNLVAIKNGRMWSYCAGQITSEESCQLISALNEHLGSDEIRFFPGVGYRHLLKITNHMETSEAVCTPPHDISQMAVAEYLPKGRGSRLLNKLMLDSQQLLMNQPINFSRVACGKIPATSVWLFWGSGPIPHMPSFNEVYKKRAALTSGVDLLRGLGQMMNMTVLNIHGVTDNINNDFSMQAVGALSALADHDLVVIHVEAPDEAGHAGNASEKIAAIEKIDSEIVSRLVEYKEQLRVLVMPDHPTPVVLRTHVAEPVPFLIWGKDVASNGACRFTEGEALRTGMVVQNGFEIVKQFIGA